MNEETRETIENFLKESEHEGWEEEGLVGRFKIALHKEDVEITRVRGKNSCILEKGGSRVGVLIHGYTPQRLETEHEGWWGVAQTQVERMRENEQDWGVVLLRGNLEGGNLDIGFWIAGENFDEVISGDLDSTGGYNITLERLNNNPDLAQKIFTVQEFLLFTRLNPM